MNIFITDYNPVIAAVNLCDKHVPKMLLESAQMLNNGIHHFKGQNAHYRPLMLKHPCSKWALESCANYKWLIEHAREINRQFQLRFHKSHKCEAVLDTCESMYYKWDWKETRLTKFVQVMPLIYRNPDVIIAYRSYYKGGKEFAVWKKGVGQPEWWDTHTVIYDESGLLNYQARGLPTPITLPQISHSL